MGGTPLLLTLLLTNRNQNVHVTAPEAATTVVAKHISGFCYVQQPFFRKCKSSHFLIRTHCRVSASSPDHALQPCGLGLPTESGIQTGSKEFH